MSLSHRRGNIQDGTGTAQASWTVTAYPVGAVVSGAGSSTPITVNAPHSLAAGDKFIVGTDTTTFRAVSGTPTATSIAYAGDALTVAVGDTVTNLGPDTGTTSPNWDASPMGSYTDPDGGTANTQARVTTDSDGEFAYYHKGAGAFWELVRDSDGAVQQIVQGVGGTAAPNVWHAADYGAKFDGATDDAARLQTPMTYAAMGDTIVWPRGRAVCGTALTCTAGVNIIGGGWNTNTRAAYASADWTDTSKHGGTIIDVSITSGTALLLGDSSANQTCSISGVLFIGPGSGTGDGVALQHVIGGMFESLGVANFGGNGLTFTHTVEDCTFTKFRGLGINGAGLYSNQSANNENSAYGIEINNCATGIQWDAGTQFKVYGGLIQACTDGLDMDGGAEMALTGVWLEDCSGDAINVTGDNIANCSFTGVHFSSNAATVTLGGGTSNGGHMFVKCRGNSTSVTVTNASNVVFSACGFSSITDNTDNAIIIGDQAIQAPALVLNADATYASGSPALEFKNIAAGTNFLMELTDTGDSLQWGFGTLAGSLLKPGFRDGSANSIFEFGMSDSNFIQYTTNAAKTERGFRTEEVTGLSGASGSTGATGRIQAGSLVLGVTVRVTTEVASAAGTSMDIGYAADPDAWGVIAFAGGVIAAGTTSAVSDFTVTGPVYFGAATDILLTCTGGTYTAGAVRVVVHYIELTAPTS